MKSWRKQTPFIFQLWAWFFNFLSFSSTFSIFPQLSQFFLNFLIFSLTFSVFPQLYQFFFFFQFSYFFFNILSFSSTFSIFWAQTFRPKTYMAHPFSNRTYTAACASSELLRACLILKPIASVRCVWSRWKVSLRVYCLIVRSVWSRWKLSLKVYSKSSFSFWSNTSNNQTVVQ